VELAGREIGHGRWARKRADCFRECCRIGDWPLCDARSLSSDILESNGSSSMATVCGAGRWRMMDSGVR